MFVSMFFVFLFEAGLIVEVKAEVMNGVKVGVQKGDYWEEAARRGRVAENNGSPVCVRSSDGRYGI